jgi:hypothetical protein
MAELSAVLGVDTSDWSLREMLWGVEAKRREQWDSWSLGLSWLINSMPRFSKSGRFVHPDRINPFRRARRGIPLRGSAGERALDAMSTGTSKEDNGR